EKGYWTGVLNRSGRLAVARAVETAAIGRAHLVRFWYQEFRGRRPTAAEAAPLIRLLSIGRSEESVLGILLGSTRAAYQVDIRTRLVKAYHQERLRRGPSSAEQTAAVNGTQTLQGLRLLIDAGGEFFNRGL
ncbi:MAG: hypothetical protein ACRC33_03310, partial [Gemmataceae bacterium]